MLIVIIFHQILRRSGLVFGLVWMTIPYRLYFTLIIQHVQLNLIVQVTWAQPSTCLAQLDCSGHMNYTLQHVQLSSTPPACSVQIYPPACSTQLYPSSMLNLALPFQHVQFNSTPPACSAQLYPSSMFSSALPLQHAQLSSTPPGCSAQLYPSNMLNSALPLQHAQLSSTPTACSTQLYPSSMLSSALPSSMLNSTQLYPSSMLTSAQHVFS